MRRLRGTGASAHGLTGKESHQTLPSCPSASLCLPAELPAQVPAQDSQTLALGCVRAGIPFRAAHPAPHTHVMGSLKSVKEHYAPKLVNHIFPQHCNAAHVEDPLEAAEKSLGSSSVTSSVAPGSQGPFPAAPHAVPRPSVTNRHHGSAQSLIPPD